MNKKEVASELNLTAIRNIPEINPGDDLSQIINGCLTDQSISLKDKDVLIIAQKIISKSEDRFIDLKTVDPSEKAIEVSKKTDKEPIDFFHEALNNVKPSLEVRSRRVGGATYQVPVEVKSKRAQALAIRWLVDSARKRKDKHMSDKIFNELFDAYEKKGAAVKKREDVHKMAESNKAFAHFRW